MATKVAQRSAGTTSAQAADQRESPHRRSATVNLPFVTAEFRAPDIHLPSLPVRAPHRSDLTDAVSAIRSRLPSPAQTLYYGGLGVLGVLELIEWPVVLAIGVGTALAQHQGREQAQDGAQRPVPAQRGGKGASSGTGSGAGSGTGAR